MTSKLIENYISKRYERWLDYALYHCSLAGLEDEAHDVLNEVLYSLLQRDCTELEQLLERKKNGYTELDFFVLRMIKLNATSDTAPYRSKYKAMPVDRNVDYTRLELEEIAAEDDEDRPAIIVDKMNQVRKALDELGLSDSARRIFEYHFFCGGSFLEWEGSESLRKLYSIYNGVLELVKRKINGGGIF